VIEHLPNDLRDRFTEMREIDLGVENTVDSLEARLAHFVFSMLTDGM
jgi:inhibitor of growth protein 3